MTLEIERKFLLANETWRDDVISHHAIYQVYLVDSIGLTMRIRIQDDQGFLTIKGKRENCTSPEFEFPIIKECALEMINNLPSLGVIKKTRHIVIYQNQKFEIDEFHDKHQGLVIAEIELASETTPVPTPSWLGKEVTENVKYLNVNLARESYTPVS